jgi:hypothetical protein
MTRGSSTAGVTTTFWVAAFCFGYGGLIWGRLIDLNGIELWNEILPCWHVRVFGYHGWWRRREGEGGEDIAE